ncbi:MAG: thioredoxin family protein, partial [Chitinophagaceae bacterium]|nr:thioredoxin family protein [Chitinophagaceae bacterium]
MQRSLISILLFFPLAVFSQNNLSGLWRLKDSKITRGADYVNAIPVSIMISQSENTVEIEVTNDEISPEQLLSETAKGNGVKFTDGLTWEQIKTKAKKENKYIFVDCYATWCAPCKEMDKYVYPLEVVGQATNKDFISVKVQIDSVKNDANHIQLLYPLARKLKKEYNINALPTYLFFSPDGTP